MKAVLSGASEGNFFIVSDEPVATQYFSFVPQYAKDIKEKNRGIIFIGESYVFGLLSGKDFDGQLKDLQELCQSMT
jgi:hypothetical protein